MSARVEKADDEVGVLWIIYEGRGDELAANLQTYCVEFVPSLYFSRVGIPYRPGLSSQPTAFGVFAGAACSMIDLLTACRGVTEQEEREFAVNLMTVQSSQEERMEAAV